jgi:pimeloyl-ACP methyl ester carboxylesterase
VERPRILLVPEFTELTWTIKPQLEEWADVASYDLPGVGAEPRTPLNREAVIARGFREWDDHGWEQCFIVGDGWGIPTAVGIARQRPDRVRGLALGHARLSNRRHGDRAPINNEVFEAITQLMRQDHKSFIRYGIVQATRGSVDEELAQQMINRFPKDLILSGWEQATREDERFEKALKGLELPLLLGKHEGCLMSTDEGFEDAVAALPGARTVVTDRACEVDPAFAGAIRAFCAAIVAAEQR